MTIYLAECASEMSTSTWPEVAGVVALFALIAFICWCLTR